MVSILNQKQKNSTQVTRKDLIELYKSRYVNEKGIKKYAKIDEQKLSHIFGLLQDEYLAFVCDVMQMNDIQFSMDRTQYCRFDETNGAFKVKVFSNLDDETGKTFFHELGHAVELCRMPNGKGWYQLLGIKGLGSSHNVSFGDVVHEELRQNAQSIKAQILDAHRFAVEDALGRETYQAIADNDEFLREYEKIGRKVGGLCGFLMPSLQSKRKPLDELHAKYSEMTKQVIEKGMIRAKNALKDCPAHKLFREDNEVVLDALSSVYDMNRPYDLQMHNQSYFMDEYDRVESEIWANLFAIKVTGREDLLANVQRYLPKTYETFQGMFDMVIEFYRMQRELRLLRRRA